MDEIHPFRAWRYNLSKVHSLENVITPPYDVIDSALSDQLHQKNPYNVIRLILDPIRPTDDDKNNRYTRSARTLKDWQSSGIVQQEERPSIYVYYQTFDWKGSHIPSRIHEPRSSRKVWPGENLYPTSKHSRGPRLIG